MNSLDSLLLVGDQANHFLPLAGWVFLGAGIAMALHACGGWAARRRGLAAPPPARWHWWERLLYAVAVLALLDLSVTAFYAVAVHGHLGGWWLLGHMVGAGTFLGVLPLLALTWCRPCCFELPSRSDQRQASGAQDEGQAAVPLPAPRRFSWLGKLTFWLMMISGIVVAGTMLLSMFPLFGTHMLEELLDLHRYSGLVLAAASLLHLYSVCANRFGLG
ncbi:MAG TPA: hypothetical protein EYP14_17485 [Planctomycetaceae bacterium]|nr:hypothetical protein [Planctomycetaceae bacterium]